MSMLVFSISLLPQKQRGRRCIQNVPGRGKSFLPTRKHSSRFTLHSGLLQLLFLYTGGLHCLNPTPCRRFGTMWMVLENRMHVKIINAIIPTFSILKHSASAATLLLQCFGDLRTIYSRLCSHEIKLALSQMTAWEFFLLHLTASVFVLSTSGPSLAFSVPLPPFLAPTVSVFHCLLEFFSFLLSSKRLRALYHNKNYKQEKPFERILY